MWTRSGQNLADICLRCGTDSDIWGTESDIWIIWDDSDLAEMQLRCSWYLVDVSEMCLGCVQNVAGMIGWDMT